MRWDIIINFLVLMFLVSGVIIFALHRLFVKSVEGAVQRLDREAETARARQAELNQKIADMDEEIERRRVELNEMETKIKGKLEEEAIKEKEEIVGKAREEAEDIITKAQNAGEGIKKDVEKEMDLRIIDFSAQILNDIFTEKAKGALNQQLITDFIAQLKDVDMSRIGAEVKEADVVTVDGIDDGLKNEINGIIKDKLSREITLNVKNDNNIVGGLILQFDSLQLDGSLRDAIKVAAVSCKEERSRANA